MLRHISTSRNDIRCEKTWSEHKIIAMNTRLYVHDKGSKKDTEGIDSRKVAKTRHEALTMCFASFFDSCICDHWLLLVGIGEERENVFVDAFFPTAFLSTDIGMNLGSGHAG